MLRQNPHARLSQPLKWNLGKMFHEPLDARFLRYGYAFLVPGYMAEDRLGVLLKRSIQDRRLSIVCLETKRWRLLLIDIAQDSTLIIT